MILERTLTNGLEVVINPTDAPVAALQVWVDVGSIDEKPEEAGYCHFLEHMVFKGTAKRSTAQIAGAIEGAGGEMNAFTSFEYTVYHITISHDRWQVANEILSDMVLRSTFLKKEFDPEKEVILEEIKRGEDSPDRQLYRGAYEQLYGSTWYGRPVIGFPKTVKACSEKKLMDFWKRWYSPELITVVACGNIDPEEFVKHSQKVWTKTVRSSKAPSPRKRRRDLAMPNVLRMTKVPFSEKTFPISCIRWVGTLPGCDFSDEILPALEIASMTLGQGETSRLHRRLFREEKLVTSVGAGIWAPRGTGMFSFDVEATVESGSAFKKPFFEEVSRFCDEGPTKTEFERAKVNIESDRIYSAQSMDGLGNRLGFLKTVLGNVHFDLEYLAKTRELTPEDVKAAAKDYLHMDVMREFALFPKDYSKDKFWNVSPKQKRLEKSQQFTLDRKQVVKKSVVPKGEHLVLPNGLELVLYPRHDIPTISIQTCALGGLRAETEKTAGIGHLLSEVWEKGPKDWTADRFSEFLESRASSIDSFSGRNSVGLGCTTLTHYLDDVLPLFVDTLIEPALDSSEFRHAQQLSLEDIRTAEDYPERACINQLLKSLFGKHPYSHSVLGLKESVSSLTSENLVDHFKNVVSRARMVVSISGKFNPEHVIKSFEKVGRPEFETNRNTHIEKLMSFEFPKKSIRQEITKKREQSHVVIGFPGIRVSDKERYSLRLLMTILGGQSGRLFRELRDKKGLCYTVSPLFFEGIEPGYVGVYMGCDPKKLKIAIEGIQNELDRISTRAISAKELERSKEFLLGRHHLDIQLNASISSSAAFNTLFHQPFDEHERLKERLKNVSPTSILKLSKRLFNQPSVTSIVV